MTIAQTKAARRRMMNNPRFKKAKGKSVEAKLARKQRAHRKATAKGKSFGVAKG